MFKNKSILILLLAGLFWINGIKAQEGSGIANRSQTIQIVDGKEYFFHAVLQGQTLFSIARAYGVSVEDIERENPEVKDHGLRYNQMIRIPVARTPVQERAPQREVKAEQTYSQHQVKRRETVYGIARMYNISMEDLIKHNPEIRSGLRINMLLRIPKAQQKVVQYRFYTVPPQQTLFSISREFNISIEELEQINPELREGLKAGQVIKIPVAGEIHQPPFVSEPIEDSRLRADALPTDPYCINPRLKQSYNVALLIPLNFDPASLPANHPSFAFIEYYEGIVIALDSIRKKGADIRLHVFDVCDSLPKVRSVLRKPEMTDMDLIIGPFHPNSLEIAGEFARVRNIPIISPLFREDNRLLSRFSNMFQATPSVQVQMNEMARYVAQNYPDDNLILVHNNQPASINFVKEYKRFINNELNHKQYRKDSLNLAKVDGYFMDGVYVGERITNVYVLNDTLLKSHRRGTDKFDALYQLHMQRDNVQEVVYTHDGMHQLKTKLDTNRRNIVISLMGGQALIANYTRQLNQLRDTFNLTVFGVREWANYESLDYNYLQNLNVHLFTPDFIDYESKSNIDFIRRYREAYYTEPGAVSFKAAQTGIFFFTALMQYGSEFYKCIDFINMNKASSSPFWFQRVGAKGGWENMDVSIYKFENFRIKRVSDIQNRMAVHQ